MSRLSLPPPPSIANTGRNRSQSRRPQSRSYKAGRPSKRLVLCEDGSWLNSDSSNLSSALSIESNVTRISRAVKPLSSDGIPQIVYYHWGVGGSGGFTEKIVGIGGGGLAEIVREGYEFIATNYIPGDEIFIFGFSRGAFTARSIAGVIGQIGVLTNDGLPYFPEIFRDLQHQHNPNYRPKHPDIPFPNKPRASDPAYREELRARNLTRLDIPIKVVGVWETVGALGLPKVGWLTRLGIQSTAMRELAFYDTALSDSIEYAFQALALDERRFAFQPTLWEKPRGNTTTLRQVWFPGAHSNVGGGYNDQQIATISLAWMMSQCQPFLDFNLNYVLDQWEEAENFYEHQGQKIRPWSFGKIFDGLEGIYALGGSKVRTPGRYCAVDPISGRPTHDPLIETHEYIHPCVRSRIKLHGPGLQDRGDYTCKSLENWRLTIDPPQPGDRRPHVYWRSRERPEDGFVRELPEAPLWKLELELLSYDPQTEQYVMKPSASRQRKNQRRNPSRSRSLPPD